MEEIAGRGRSRKERIKGGLRGRPGGLGGKKKGRARRGKVSDAPRETKGGRDT